MSGTLTLNAAIPVSNIRMSIIRAKTAIYYIDVQRSDGTPFDLTGSSMYFHASNGSFSIDYSTVTGGIDFTDATEGLATLTIFPAATESLGAQGVFGMPCEFTLVNGSPVGTLELATGNLTISPNVGTP